MTDHFAELNPPPRLLMGPGPVGVDPRVLRALSMPMLGQFDPAFTAYMNAGGPDRHLLRRSRSGAVHDRWDRSWAC